MIFSDEFKYVNVMSKAADAVWLRNEAIANNIANADTPGYKRQDISFEGELRKALKSSRYQTLGKKVANLRMNDLEPRTYRDYESMSYRLDGNNVDPQTENVVLMKNQIKYNAIIQAINGEFNSLKMVMK